MEEIRLCIHPFKMGTEKEAALKPLEEAAETFAAWQNWKPFDSEPVSSSELNRHSVLLWVKQKKIRHKMLADEIADCIQACANLAARYDIDLGAAMERCEERNRDRGRYPLRGEHERGE